LKKPVIIAAAVLLALLAAAGIILIADKKDSTPDAEASHPNVRIMKDTTETSDPVEESYLRQIAELKSQVERLEQEKGEAEFDRAALQAEQDSLQKRLADLEDQIVYLRDRNNALSGEGQNYQGAIAARDKEIAELNEKLEKLETERNASEIAYQKALARTYEYRESLDRRDEALTEAESTGTTHITRRGDLVSTFNILPPGHARNVLGIKFGTRDVDIEGTLALLPHWFLLADIGVSQVPDDFVRDELPGYDADHAFFYEVLAGTGLNWRFNSIQCQPNFYISTMAGPAWFYYKIDGDIDMKTYLLWRSSVGFDVTLHKHLQFTGDISFDWVPDYRFTPRFTLGVLWSFSNEWAIIRKK
jgi:hypothetical protein